MLVLAGIYIVWFWVTELTSDAGQSSWIARVVDGWSSDLTNLVDRNSTLLGWLLGSVVAAAILAVFWRPADEGSEKSELLSSPEGSVA
jgi:hypothetical protein